jgi:serine/threonine protein kinase
MKERMKDLSGETITGSSGKKYILGKPYGYGAQGVVYEDATERKMIKFYYPNGSSVIDEDIIDRLHFIQNIEMPPNFVKVEDVIEKPYVGYVMEKVVDHVPLNSFLIPDKEMSFAEWYNQGFGLRQRIFIGYVIAKAFKSLEKRNLSYCDISGNNILVKIKKVLSKTGASKTSISIKMIDVDNIYIAGKGAATVLGTPRYIAPEVIDRKRNPDVLSDNYSLAVILFELLRIGHPYISDDVLDGSPEDEEAALAGKYEYVTDANSKSMLPEDIVLTDKLKKLFRRCFVDGKKNRLSRPTAQEFEFALLEATNKVIKCPSCGAWHYPGKSGRVYGVCPWCDAPSKPAAKLNFYNLLREGESYRNGAAIDKRKQPEADNTYILREGKNYIKNLYVLKYDEATENLNAEENFMTIAKNREGYWAYNEFFKEGIVVQRWRTKEYLKIENNDRILLENGDLIFFEQNVKIEIGGKKYSFVRMARFLEEAK